MWLRGSNQWIIWQTLLSTDMCQGLCYTLQGRGNHAPALIPRSVQIGEEDRIEGRWRLLLPVARQGRGEWGGRREGGAAGERGSAQGTVGEAVAHPDPPGILYPTSPPQAWFSNNFGLQLPPACHVSAQSFFEIWSCS